MATPSVQAFMPLSFGGRENWMEFSRFLIFRLLRLFRVSVRLGTMVRRNIMVTTTITTRDPIVPTAQESAIAREATRVLAPFIDHLENLKFEVGEGRKAPHRLSLPASAVRLLLDLLTEMAAGNAVTLIPVHAQLTTQQAADALNVSRPFLVSLLEQGKIPHIKVGTHRRVLFEDLMRYKKQIDTDRRKVLDELVKQSETMSMGY
jgi:excisionase family DNA binding protein